MQIDDQEILQLLRESPGNQKAFAMLVRKYKERVYWHIRRMVFDHDDADDITQNTFIKVWQGLPGFRGDSSLYSWIYRIASNETFTYINALKKRQAFNQPFEETMDGRLTQALSPDADEMEAKLQKALLTLPEKQKLVFNLRYYDELPYEEMSKILGTSVGALKASYHLAAKKVEKFLNDD
jgi:RNA polymerase sigma factor (sigma-70 family)